MIADGGAWAIWVKGGWVMFPLLVCSILSLAIFAERVWTLRKQRGDAPALLGDLRPLLKRKDDGGAEARCAQDPSTDARVLRAGVMRRRLGADAVRNAGLLQVKEEGLQMSRWIDIVGTIGNIAPFIGLFGTVLGIIRSFRDIAVAGSGGATVVMAGLSEALIATASGLFVAITSVIFFNILVRWIDRRQAEMENAVEALAQAVDEEAR